MSSPRAKISDVAAAARTSTATVSRVLNGFPGVAPDLISRVRRAADDLGYRKNTAASALRSGRRTLVGAVVPDLSNPFFTDVIRGLEDTVGPAGYLLLVCNTNGELERESAYFDLLAAQHLAGVVIAPASEHHTRIRQAFEANLPVVAVDRRPWDQDVHSVVLDNKGGANRLVSALLGRSLRVGIIGGPPDSTTGHNRFAGYRLALESAGRTWSMDDVRLGPYTQAYGYDAAREILDRPDRPDALFLGNNTLALGALRAINDLGLANSSLQLGFFDPVAWPAELAGHVTSLAGPTYELGIRAGKILLDHIERDDAMPMHVELDTGPIVFG